MVHTDISLFMHTLDRIGEIAGFADIFDAESDQCRHGEANQRQPQAMELFGPTISDKLPWDRVPYELKEEEQNFVVQEGADSTNNADCQGNCD